MEPIAIVGMACRFPGADGLESFWRVLRDGRDAVGEVPSDRWDPRRFPGTSRWGGFLPRVDGFDPSFFGISPRAAAHRACQSLGRSESEGALAGGVNLILTPAITIGFSRLKAMASDGRCKTF